MSAKDGNHKTDEREKPVKVGMISLGCAKNLVDGEVMLGHLSSGGISVTADPDEADVVVVNTCGFVTDAKAESIDSILEVVEAKKQGRVKRLVVSGCMAQAYAQDLKKEIPEIDAFIGLDELEEVASAVRGERAGSIPDQRGAVRLYDHANPRLLSTNGFAYLKVAEGCNNPCSFCHIPAMRGDFRSRSRTDLLAEAKRLDAAGVRELVLIAQDTTRYGEDLGLKHGLRDLVSSLLDETGIPWIRFLYAYPSTLDEDLFALMADNDRFVPYLDIPLQHASRKVLKAMKRGGDARRYAELIRRARAAVPDLAVRTTFIVGFPGEDREAVKELVDFIQEIRFDHLGVFSYSWQEENPGAELGDPVSEEEKAERMAEVLEVQQAISLTLNSKLVGKILPAIVAGPLPEMELLTEGRLKCQAPEIDGRLLINDGTAAPGTLIEAEITEAHPYDLVGRVAKVIEAAPASRRMLPVIG